MFKIINTAMAHVKHPWSTFHGFKFFVTLLCLLLNTTEAYTTGHAILSGTVSHVRDGDTIEISKIPIRLNGVSAPELDEPLGWASKQFIIDLVKGKQVTCKLTGTKTFDRFVGTCYFNEKDIGITIIGAGLALDCPRFSGGRYAKFELLSAKKKISLPAYCQD